MGSNPLYFIPWVDKILHSTPPNITPTPQAGKGPPGLDHRGRAGGKGHPALAALVDHLVCWYVLIS